MKAVNRQSNTIDYRLNLLGIRICQDGAQLIAKWRDKEWTTIGPMRSLPLRVPMTPTELSAGANDTLRLTAYQYEMECPGSDIRAVLALEKNFESAMETSVAAGTVPAQAKSA